MFDHFAAPLHNWQGLSGRWYPHSVLSLAQARTWSNTAHYNYIFVRTRYAGLFDPLYIGETDCMGRRLMQHEHLADAITGGLTHVHVHVLAGTRFERERIETDLRHVR